MSLDINKRIDNYQIESKIKDGGMAKVYKAFDLVNKSYVALKILNNDSDIKIKQRFKREFDVLSKIKHYNIIDVYHYDEEKGYYSMELVSEGRTLDEVLKDGIPNIKKTISFIKQICDGLHVAHQYNVIHRDIKPSNIFLINGQTIKIADFGIASLIDSNLTQHGDILGTATYLSPEQARGSTVQFASDIYSLGVVFYELVTGTVPFKHKDKFEVLSQHLNLSLEAPSPREHVKDIDPELEKIVKKCLKKNLSERYQNVLELLNDLSNLSYSYGLNFENITLNAVNNKKTKEEHYSSYTIEDTIVSSSNKKVKIRFVSGEKKDLEFILELIEDKEITLGRSIDCDIPFSKDKEISKKHIRMGFFYNKCYIADLESTNGTLINNQKIESKNYILIKSGDKVQIGQSVFIIVYL